jgi:hypothetical protein
MIKGVFQETLRCELTPGEVAERSGTLAIVQKKIEDVTAEAKGTAESFREVRKRLEADRTVLAREVREESTYRSIDCTERIVKRRGAHFIERVRSDTNKVIGEPRLATEKEKQMEFPTVEPLKKDAPAKPKRKAATSAKGAPRGDEKAGPPEKGKGDETAR